MPGAIEKRLVEGQWVYLSRDWFPLVTKRTTRQDGRVYTQEWVLPRCDFGLPSTIVETGDFTRTTSYVYETTTGSVYRAPRPTTVTVEGATQGLTTTFTYDHGVMSGTHTALTDVTMAINADGTVDTATRTGCVTQATRTTPYGYDAAGRLTSVQSPLGPTASHPTVTEYAADHSWVQVSRGTAFTKTCVDGFGRTKATIASAGQRNGSDLFTRVDTAYDGLGRVAYTSLPYETTSTTCPLPATPRPGTTFEYDGSGRMTRRTNPDAT